MTDSYRPVDPLTGKTMGVGAYTPSPNLQQRIKEQRERTTDAGRFRTRPDGGLEFVPKGVLGLAEAQCIEPDELVLDGRAFKRGDMVHVRATPAELQAARRPLSAIRAWGLAGHLCTVAGFAQDRSAVVVEAAGSLAMLQPEHLSVVTEGQGLAAAEAGVLSPAEASRLFAQPPREAPAGSIARGSRVWVTATQSQCADWNIPIDDACSLMRQPVQVLGLGTGCCTVRDATGRCWSVDTQWLRLADYQPFDPLAEPLHRDDWVEVISGPNAGKQGAVRVADGHHAATIRLADNSGLLLVGRANLRLLTKAPRA